MLGMEAEAQGLIPQNPNPPSWLETSVHTPFCPGGLQKLGGRGALHAEASLKNCISNSPASLFSGGLQITTGPLSRPPPAPFEQGGPTSSG